MIAKAVWCGLLVAVACRGYEEWERVRQPAIGRTPTDEHESGEGFRTVISVEVALAPATVVAQKPTRLTITLGDTSAAMPTELEPIAGRPLHVMAVSRDLLWWTDSHPEEQVPGKFSTELTFPSIGQYVVFTLFRPKGAKYQVHKTHIQVGSGVSIQRKEPIPSGVQLEPTPLTRIAGNYQIELKIDPAQPVAGQWTTLTFHLTRGGQPVTTLNRLDRLGHLVIVREGAEEFVYAHSTEEEAVGGVRAKLHVPALPEDLRQHELHSTHGPDVSFHTVFPSPSLYRLWADFTPAKDHLQVDYVVSVR